VPEPVVLEPEPELVPEPEVEPLPLLLPEVPAPPLVPLEAPPGVVALPWPLLRGVALLVSVAEPLP